MVETPDDRARGPSPTPQEVSLQALMALINETFDKQNEDNRMIREEIRTQISENNRLISEKLDKQSEENRLVSEKNK